MTFQSRWPAPSSFWAEGCRQVEQNRTYAKIGAFVEGFEFDWRRWRQPPGTLAQIDPCQLWAVEVAASALSTLDTAMKGDRLTEAELAWSLPTPWAVRTATNPISGFGLNATARWRPKLAYLLRPAMLSWTPWSKAPPKSRRTPCLKLANVVQDASPTCSASPNHAMTSVCLLAGGCPGRLPLASRARSTR